MRNKNTNYIMTASIQRFTTFFTCSAILFIILGSKTEVDSSDIKSLDITDLLVLFVVLDVDIVSLFHLVTVSLVIASIGTFNIKTINKF